MHRREARRRRATAIAMGLLAAMLLQLGPLGVDAAGAEYAHLDPPFADATTARASPDPDAPPRDALDPRTGPMVHASAMPEAPTAPSRGHLVRIAFEGADPVLPQPRGELPHHANFFLRATPPRWRPHV